jgi:hypothetical protein
MTKSLVLLGLFISLTACTDGVDIAKNSLVPMSSDLLNADVLDDREMCEDTEWEVLSEKNGNETVEYKCLIKNFDDYIEGLKELSLDNINEKFDRDSDASKKWLESKRLIAPSREEREKEYDDNIENAKNSRDQALEKVEDTFVVTEAYDFIQWRTTSNEKLRYIKSGIKFITNDGKEIEFDTTEETFFNDAQNIQLLELEDYRTLRTALSRKFGIR